MSSNREPGSDGPGLVRSAKIAGVSSVVVSGLGALMVYLTWEDPTGAAASLGVVTIALVVAGFVASIVAFALAANARDTGHSAWVGALAGAVGLVLVGWSLFYTAHTFSLAFH